MKKILSIVLMALLALPVMAGGPKRDRAERDYTKWHPEAGDFSIGLSIDPLASFVGNMLNGTQDNELDDMAGEALKSNQASILGSYQVSEKLGIKANIGFKFGNVRNRYYVTDDKAVALDPLSLQKVVDARKTVTNGGSLAVGIDYRRGKRAVQGVFGAGIVYGFDVNKTRYSYGNAITEINQQPSTAFTGVPTLSTSYIPYGRPVKQFTNDINHWFGIYSSVGVEWFVAPKIALGANVNLNLLYESGAQKYVEYEGWNTATGKVEEFTELRSPGDSKFDFGVENIGANLYISFYF